MRSDRYRLTLALPLAALLVAGCQKDEIREYDVPRPEPVVRLLGAIVPHGDSTWFFKLVGPVAAVGERKADFDGLVDSVRFGGGKDDPATWKLPAGWTEEKGPAPRHATLKFGPADAPLELSVSKLGSGGQTASVLANVNRWRRLDLGLGAALPEEDLPEVVREKKVNDLTVTFVDMSGPGAGTHAKPARPMREEPVPAEPREPAEQPRVDYVTPEGWQPAPTNMGGFRAEAAFRIREGDKSADVNVMIVGGPFAENVNRWRKQIGLPPVSEAEVRKEVRPITIDGAPGHLADLVGPESQGAKRQRILGAIVDRDGGTWYFKMRGSAELVEKQQGAFDKFLASFKFNGGR